MYVEGRHTPHGCIVFSVTATAVAVVFEGPVRPLARNRMKNSAVQKYGAQKEDCCLVRM